MVSCEEKALYVPGSTRILTFLNREGVCAFSGETVEQMQAKYPAAVILPYLEADALSDKAIAEKYLTGPVEITKARFMEKLGALPPILWITHCGAESFLFAELVAKDIGTFFARIGDRCFEVNAPPTRTRHQEIMVMIIETFAPAPWGASGGLK